MNLIDNSIRHNRSSSKEKQLSVDEIIQFCLDMRSSAQDTIINTVSFILQFLARSPEDRTYFHDKIASRFNRENSKTYQSYSENIVLG